MKREFIYRLSADLILAIHGLFIIFVILGLVLIIAGTLLKWQFIENFRFRLLHLLCIGVVVVQAWASRLCPLTTWESRLREAAGDSVYEETFIQHWLHNLIFLDLPWWVFQFAYTLFGLLILLFLIIKPPRLPQKGLRISNLFVELLRVGQKDTKQQAEKRGQ